MASSSAASTQAVLTDAADRVDLDAARSLVAAHYGVDAVVTRLSGERDDNFRVDSDRGTWMLKVAHGAEARAVTEFQSEILAHLEGGKVSVPSVIPTVAGTSHEWLADGPAAGRAIRMTTFSPGVLLRDVPLVPGLARSIGCTVAELGLALADFRHPGADVELLWDVQQAHQTRKLVDDRPALPGEDILRAGFDHFLEVGVPKLSGLPRQVIHNDANPDNILVESGEPPEISLVDFGDAVIAPRVVDLAVAASYHVGLPSAADQATPLGAATDVILGYVERTPLYDSEIELLHELLIARVLTAITIASWRAARFPDNDDYILRNTASAWRRLEILQSADRRTVTDDLLRRCAPR
ncbi:phosphotransferase [Gordonia sp. zg691]|uniref:phosphotransferase n=1 Tax=Gordonia jinghuaiqii TaxID=2758710 RepID=UPI00166231B6|nr:phosphotransferase [Gordonia jinghuaiqii]MBD0860388.1 phosphotransferase [Gordonia jinghuaiqii]